MDKSIGGENGTNCRMTCQQKSLTPAVLGISSGPHGAKLSSNMNSRDREKLLMKLEVWREIRKERLSASILAKGRGSSKSSAIAPTLPKVRTISNPSKGNNAKQSQCYGNKNVFDRLYENAGRAALKKTENIKSEKLAELKNLPTVQACKFSQPRKVKVPKVIISVDDYDNTSDGTLKDIGLSLPIIENVCEGSGEGEVDDVGNLSNDVQETTVLPVGEENVLTKPNEISMDPDKIEGALIEISQEISSSVLTQGNVPENRNEIDAKADGLKKDEEDTCLDVKKNVCFETPRENTLSATYLRNKLEDWLTENGHSIDTYRHLRCFGLNAEKTPVPYYRQARVDDLSNSSFYSTAPNTPVAEVISESDKENITPVMPAPKIDTMDVEGWLTDLHSLIVHVKYPSDRCEEWLSAITRKFPICTQLPIYWECLAAMNENFNNLKLSEQNEESERRTDDHEASIAGLLDKLVIDENCQSASKTERGLSMKNIFNSKTVKFALHEKAVKDLNPELGKEGRRKVLVATPVRRSARLQTPDNSNIVGSLRSLDPETRKNVSFQPNDALITG